MDGVKTRFTGIWVALMLAALALFALAAAAQAQTPAEDQYGSPTGSSLTGGAGDDTGATADPGGTEADGITGTAPGSGDTGSDGSVASEASARGSSEAGGSDEAAGGISNGVLPSTGGAPIYLALAGAILIGTGATLWTRFRAES